MNRNTIIIGVGVVFVIGNVLWLDYRSLNPAISEPSGSTALPLEQHPIITPLVTFPSPSEVPMNYLSEDTVKSATDSLTLRVETLEKKAGQPTFVATGPKTDGVSEYYIPLGSGSTNATNWVDLPGVEAYVAPSNYGTIKSIYFEASLRNPTANGVAYARLINVTDNTSLFETEVSYEGSTGKLISSGAFPIPRATKLYRVQLKSSIGADIFLDSARIKIYTR